MRATFHRHAGEGRQSDELHRRGSARNPGADRLPEAHDIIGRTDLIEQISRGAEHLDDLDLNPLLVRVDSPHPPYCASEGRNEPPAESLDARNPRATARRSSSAARSASSTYNVRNTQRAIGARASAHVVRQVRHARAAGGTARRSNLRGSCGPKPGRVPGAGHRARSDRRRERLCRQGSLRRPDRAEAACGGRTHSARQRHHRQHLPLWRDQRQALRRGSRGRTLRGAQFRRDSR